MSKQKKKSCQRAKNTVDPKQFASLLEEYTTEEQREEFLSKLNEESISSLLLDADKLSRDDLLSSFDKLIPSERDPLLFRFKKSSVQMGKTLEHFAGAFYILDPSSAAISLYLAPMLPENPRVIDLCAAPGGKSISLALRRKDALIKSGDISRTRIQEMIKNVERMGLTNIATYNIDPLEIKTEGAYDAVILDAPCSGSGMIRKEIKMLEDYSEEKVARLLPVQEQLLEKAYHLLKKGGILAYSTCSLSVSEDEDQVQKLLKKHKDLELIPIDYEKRILPGKDKVGYHMVPGIYDGEGIFFALIKKAGKEVKKTAVLPVKQSGKDSLITYQDKDYLISEACSSLFDERPLSLGLKVKEEGPHPKIEYDHAYSKRSLNFPRYDLDRQKAILYASGSELASDTPIEDGIYILTYKNIPLGFGKVVQNRIKNCLPKRLRTFGLI